MLLPLYFLVIIFITPPDVPLPYRTAPPPGITSILSISLILTTSIGTFICEVSSIFAGTPSTKSWTVAFAFWKPCPLTSTAGRKPSCTFTPGTESKISDTEVYPFVSISFDVII